MKTNFELKKRNNVQKTSLNVAAIFISLVILSLTVDAQGIWKSFLEMKNAGDNAVTLANNSGNLLYDNETGFSEANSNAVYSELATEATLNLKDWMTNESYFEVNTAKSETEDALQLEDWMTNENYFSISTFQFDTETDSPLELEDWMLNEDYFEYANNEEQPLPLENWMVAANYWINE